MNALHESNRDLLRSCFEDNAQAIQKFANISYSNEVERTVRACLETFCPQDDDQLVDSLIEAAIEEVYKRWKKLPQPGKDLRICIRECALAYTKKWIKHKRRHRGEGGAR